MAPLTFKQRVCCLSVMALAAVQSLGIFRHIYIIAALLLDKYCIVALLAFIPLAVKPMGENHRLHIILLRIPVENHLLFKCRDTIKGKIKRCKYCNDKGYQKSHNHLNESAKG